MAISSLAALLLAAPASASILFATSYNDHSLNVLSLEGSALTVKSKSYDCGSEPTWLTLNYAKKALYCLNEGWGGNASITSYETKADGSLAERQVLSTLKSPVASLLYGPNKEDLAVAYYDTSSVGFFYNPGDYGYKNPYALNLAFTTTFTMSGPGPVPDRQDVPHPHFVVSDPTGRYLFFPDLGADLIRIYQVTTGSGGTVIQTKALEPFKAVPGSGPRHGAFAKVNGSTYFYTVNELGNSITAYQVTYPSGAPPKLTQISNFSTHGPGGSVPAGTKAAEIVVSPDQRFLLLSSRGESTLSIPNFDPSNSTALPSDPLISYAIDGATGKLSLVQTAPAGGRNPRGFSLNKAGTLVASALQDDNRVVVIERDVSSGKLGKIVAHAEVGVGAGNGPNYAIFYE